MRHLRDGGARGEVDHRDSLLTPARSRRPTTRCSSASPGRPARSSCWTSDARPADGRPAKLLAVLGRVHPRAARRSRCPRSPAPRACRCRPRTGWSPSSCAWGALERDDDGRYRIGLRLWELGALAPRGLGLREAALPFMEDLYEVTHENVQLAVRDGRRGGVRRADRRPATPSRCSPRSAAASRCHPTGVGLGAARARPGRGAGAGAGRGRCGATRRTRSLIHPRGCAGCSPRCAAPASRSATGR